MSRKVLCLSAVLSVAVLVGGCSKKEEDVGWKPKEYDEETQKVRKFIHRDGIITRALEEFRAATDVYPTTDQGLQALVSRPKGLRDPKRWTGPYLEEDQLSDHWGNPFGYTSPGKEKEHRYDLWSVGADGEVGTDDDILNWNVR